MMNVLALCSAVALTILIIQLVLTGRLFKVAMDQPNARSLHTAPVPRMGGVAMMAGTLLAWSISGRPPLPVFIATCGLILLSFVDDLRGLSFVVRLAAQVILALIALQGIVGNSPLAIFIGTLFATVWMTNLYNFMDGSDGLAGGMAVSGFGAYAVTAYFMNDAQLAMLSLSVAVAALAFLWFNFHPARLFMGDAGSIPLGFLAAAFGIMGVARGLWPVWFPVLVFSPFIVDASLTLIRRGLRGEKVWHAHREHYYQRLVQKGGGHRRTALAEYIVMILAGLSAVAGVLQPSWAVPLLICWVMVYAMLAVGLEIYFRRNV